MVNAKGLSLIYSAVSVLPCRQHGPAASCAVSQSYYLGSHTLIMMIPIFNLTQLSDSSGVGATLSACIGSQNEHVEKQVKERYGSCSKASVKCIV